MLRKASGLLRILSFVTVTGLLATACEMSAGDVPSNAAVVKVVANTNLTPWLKGTVDQFNQASVKISNGQQAYVQLQSVDAGQAAADMTSGTSLPGLWIPDDDAWVAVLASKGQAAFQGDCQSVAKSPLVIDIWRPIAEALGWPGRALGWLDLGTLAADPSSWAYYTGGQYGATLRVGHTHPGLSGSGSDTLLAVVHAARNKTSTLTAADINDPVVQASVTAFEGTVATFSQSTEQLGQTMETRGIKYLSAAIMYESTVVNDGGGGADGLVAVYPYEGTFMSTNPACVNGTASAPVQEAARAFRDFLLKPQAQRAALAAGLRPVNNSVPLSSPIDAAHGVDPAQPKVLFSAPNAESVLAVGQLWQAARKAVNLFMLIDTSGSMQGEKIDAVRNAAEQFVKQMGDSDYLTLITFASRTNVLIDHRKVSDVRDSAVQQIDGIQAGGNTTLYDTIGEAADLIAKTNSSQTSNAIVLLTDGQDTSSSHYEFNQDLIDKAAANNTTVFTIAYGSDADTNVLSQLASQGRGQFFQGDQANIASIYQQMSAAFGGSVGIGR